MVLTIFYSNHKSLFDNDISMTASCNKKEKLKTMARWIFTNKLTPLNPQQPVLPFSAWQQVSPSLHHACRLPGFDKQVELGWRICPPDAGTLVAHGILTPFDWRHLPSATSHVVPLGQQCRRSEQQTACKKHAS